MARDWVKKGTFIGRTSVIDYLESKGFKVIGIEEAFNNYHFTVQRKNGKRHTILALLGDLVQGYGSIDSEHYRERFVQGGNGSVLQILGFRGV